MDYQIWIGIICLFVSWLNPSRGQNPGVDANSCVPESLEPLLQVVNLSDSFTITAQFPRNINCLVAGVDVRVSSGEGSGVPWFYSTLVISDKYSIVLSEEDQTVTVTIHQAAAEDSHSVYVYQQGFTHLSKSKHAEVIVVTPPSHLDIPSSSINTADDVLEFVAREGRPLSISCLTSLSFPAPVVTWYRCRPSEGINLDCTGLATTQTQSNPMSSGLVKSDGVYKLSAPNQNDNGAMLMCRASQSVQGKGLVSREIEQMVRLNIQYPPAVSINSPGRGIANSVLEGDTVRFFCSARANPPEVTWRWYLDDVLQTDVITSELTIPTILGLKYDRKNLTCSANNSIGEPGKITVDLSVRYGPQLVNISDHLYLNATGKGTLMCVIRGNPTPTVAWTLKETGDSVAFRTDVYHFDGGKDKFGIYSCTGISNDVRIKHDFYVVQNGPPSAAANMVTSYEFNQGDNSQTMKCEAVGTPRSTIRWMKGGRELTEANGRVEIVEEDTITGRNSLLILRQISVGDFGGYVCHMSNSWGSETVQFVVSEKANNLWLYPVIVIGSVVALITIIVLFVCCYRTRRNRRSKGDSSSGSLSGGSNSTDNSMRKPAEVQSVDGSPCSGGGAPVLPEYVDAWTTNTYPYTPGTVAPGGGGTHVSFDGLDYPSFYGSQQDTAAAYTQRGTLPNAAASSAYHYPTVQSPNRYSTYSNGAIPSSSLNRGKDVSNGFGHSLTHSQQPRVAPPEEFGFNTLPSRPSAADHHPHHQSYSGAAAASYKPSRRDLLPPSLATNV